MNADSLLPHVNGNSVRIDDMRLLETECPPWRSLSHAAGRRNLEADLPFTRDTLARIFSMTKPITSVALMMFVERGLVSLSTPLSDILPEFTDPVALVPGATSLDQVAPCASPTMQQVLTHMSGFSYAFRATSSSGAFKCRWNIKCRYSQTCTMPVKFSCVCQPVRG